MKSDLNREELRVMFDYRDGNLYWKEGRRGNRYLGLLAGGCCKRSGYSHIHTKGKRYRTHRLIWNYFNNTCEGYQIDHIDRDPQNNCIENLRLATASENRRNSVGIKDAVVPFKGVNLNRNSGKFYAQIWIDKVNKHLGTFNTAEEASAAFQAAAKALHGDFYREA